MRSSVFFGLAVVASFASAHVHAHEQHNVVLFVADGLRAHSIDLLKPEGFASIQARGVTFQNSHSLFPTFTTTNASALATGHAPGDTGDFSNTLFAGFPALASVQTALPAIEDDRVLRELDRRFGGNFLSERTLIRAAALKGYSTAVVGKLGPTAVQDIRALGGTSTIFIDDWTGRDGGTPLPDTITADMRNHGIALAAKDKKIPNGEQQTDFVKTVTDVLIPYFEARKRPFFIVFWSREPDYSQHMQTDSHGEVGGGINGETPKSAILDVADKNLLAIWRKINGSTLGGTTDIIVTSDHGFSTIDKSGYQTFSTTLQYEDNLPDKQLPPGFLAIDLAHALGLPLFDPDLRNADGVPIRIDQRQRTRHPSRANGYLGTDPASPEIVVAGNGGSDLIYLPKADDLDPKRAAQIVHFLLRQAYVSGIFVSDVLGSVPGTLPFSAINLQGVARTPVPAIVVNFSSRATVCATDAELCSAQVSDTILNQGQGMHGSFSRADTHNFTAAAGPDFRTAWVDPMPASNADVAITIAKILNLPLPSRGRRTGRVLSESFVGGALAPVVTDVVASEPASIDGQPLRTEVIRQRVGHVAYFDAAGFRGRTVGLETDDVSKRPSGHRAAPRR
ncbi:MAG: alkaline phosphatase family protein [Pseudomonadota bacterium]|nr:alkaline phosphatase family protein [Pseudomonadota bacterium]